MLVTSGEAQSSRLREVADVLTRAGHRVLQTPPVRGPHRPSVGVVVSPVGEGAEGYVERWCRAQGVPMVLVARSMMEAIIELDAWDAVAWTDRGLLRGLLRVRDERQQRRAS